MFKKMIQKAMFEYMDVEGKLKWTIEEILEETITLENFKRYIDWTKHRGIDHDLDYHYYNNPELKDKVTKRKFSSFIFALIDKRTREVAEDYVKKFLETPVRNKREDIEREMNRISEELKAFAAKEDFIDEVIKRINNKQLGGS